MSIEAALVKSNFVGKDGFVWWIGQIAPNHTWEDNQPKNLLDTTVEEKGFGHRFKVRIMGYHTARKDDLPDEQLPWATVMYPTTAGGGSRNHSQDVRLAQGTFVFGFFLDGDSGQQPVIMGCLGYNDYNEVMSTVPNTAFIPFSGYGPGDKIPAAGLKAKPNDSEKLDSNTQTKEGTNTTKTRNESATLTNTNDKANEDSTGPNAADQTKDPIPQPSITKPLPLTKMQKDIKNAIKEVEALRKSVYETTEGWIDDADDLEDKINKALDKASKKIASSMKTVYNSVNKQLQEKLEKATKPILPKVPLDKRVAADEAVLLTSDNISCLVRKLIGRLLKKILQFLLSAINQVINVPRCFVENLIANFLAALKSGIAAIIGALQNIIGGIAGIAIGALDLVSDVLGVIDDIISFLNCEDDPKESTVNEWSILSGGEDDDLFSMSDITNIIDKANGLAEQVSGLPGKTAGEIGDVISDIQDDFENIFDFTNCYTGPQECEESTLKISSLDRLPYPENHPTDSNGDPVPWKNAVGNVVVGSLGEVLGIDLISFGEGYKEDTTAFVANNCGIGEGSDIDVVVDPDTGGITDITVIEPGFDYPGIRIPGQTGGDGRVWKNPEDTAIKCGKIYRVPIPPGNIVEIEPGCEVTLPVGTSVVTEPNDEELKGTIKATQYGKFTTPTPPPDTLERGTYPSADGAYPVIMYLCDIVIVNSGHLYQEIDEVVIEPSMGAEASIQVDEFGRLIGIKVTKPGEGFKEWPTIYIKSETGYNGVLRPKLCIDRISSDRVEEVGFEKVISVVDCVGRVGDF